MQRKFLTLLFLGVFLFLLSMAKVSANGMHPHGTISPFDMQKRVHILHCQLNKHYLSSTYCPHSTTLKNKEKSVIALDCNGRTSGTLPAVSSYITSVFLSDIVHYNFELVLIRRKFTYAFYEFGFFLPDQIDHPPQTV